MWPFVTQKDYVPEKTQQSVELSSDDTMEERARKIWYLIGFVNDRNCAIPLIAYYLTLYKDLENEYKAGQTLAKRDAENSLKE